MYDERIWVKCTGKILWGINNTINATTKKTATEALSGLRMRDYLSNRLAAEESTVTNDLQAIKQDIRFNIRGSNKTKTKAFLKLSTSY